MGLFLPRRVLPRSLKYCLFLLKCCEFSANTIMGSNDDGASIQYECVELIDGVDATPSDLDASSLSLGPISAGFSGLIFEDDVCPVVSAMLPSESSKTAPLDEGDEKVVVYSRICERNQLFIVSESDTLAVPQLAQLEWTQLPGSVGNGSDLTVISEP